jgi:AAA15 family ATPase/GTPase
MRIKNIYISEYKNLKDFSINFKSDSFIEVFVGKNGTGKSNLFEALLEIFKHHLVVGLAQRSYDLTIQKSVRSWLAILVI